MSFKQDFLWGSATASAQVEGAYLEGGRTVSIWDVAKKGQIKNDETPHVASDQYHHVKEDVALMKKLGLKSYRFSLSWSRIIPQQNVVNPEGIAYYNSLIDELLENGIEPLITIYHWDTPLWIEEMGGWRSSAITAEFLMYVKTVAKAFSDRVRYWFVYNEPTAFITHGYTTGNCAPFICDPSLMRTCTLHMVQTHGQAVKVLRENALQPVKIGFAHAANAFIPNEESAAEIERAYWKTFNKGYGLEANAWYCDPLVAGKGVKVDENTYISDEEAAAYFEPLDFLGVNVYAPCVDEEYDASDKGRTSLDWIVDERGMYWVIRFFAQRYQLPIMVSENGAAYVDEVTEDGVKDPERIAFLKRYLGMVKRAVDEGIEVIGYQVWSFIDNFEWGNGYIPRFGIIYCDYANNQRRILKDSAHFYQETIAANGENLSY